jgi:PKD domain
VLVTLAALATLAGPATAQPVLGPANTVIDGPGTGVTDLSGLSIARDGTGGLVYTKDVLGVSHVFVSRLLGGVFQAPEQVDAGLPGASSQPVIAAGRGGLLLTSFINGGLLYVVNVANALSPDSAPVALFDGASNPAISISDFGKAYLAFTAVGDGGHDVRCAYYDNGQWAVESAPLDAVPADDAGTGTGRPAVAAAGDGVGIVAWGEAGHIYTRRVWATAPSVVFEQADVPSLSGWTEVSADEPAIAADGDSSYAAVVFHEVLTNGSSAQSRVLMNRLRGSQYDGVTQPDGLATPGPGGADFPGVAVTEYGRGFVTSAQLGSNQLFATALGTAETSGALTRVDSLPNSGLPYAVPATAGLTSTLIAWQQSPGATGPAEIRLRYAQDGSDLGPEQVASTPALGPTDAASGLAAAGDTDGDAAIAWVQGSGSSAAIVAAQMYQPPGSLAALNKFRYAVSDHPLLSWSAASEAWGPVRYGVSVDGVQVARTTSTRIRVPTAVLDGPHSWQVTAVNQAGLTRATRPASIWVDTVAPRVSFVLTGRRQVGSSLQIDVTDTDSRPPEPPAAASGIAEVVVRWGDGSSNQITHRASHVYRRPGRHTVTVIVKDRAGNTTTLARQVKIAPRPKPKPKKPKKPKRHTRRGT